MYDKNSWTHLDYKTNIEIAQELNTVGYATTNDATTSECHSEELLSIKSGCYDEHRCYNERGGILSADVARACA